MKKIKTIGAVSCALISGSALASSLLLTSCSKQKPDSSTQHDSGDAFVPYYFNLDSIYLNILNFRGVFRAFTQAALIKDQTYTRAMMGVNVGDEFYDIMEQKLLNGTIDEPDTTIPSDIQQKITQFMSTFDSYMSNETIKKFADDFQSLATKNSHSKQITYSDFRESFLNTLNSSSTFWQS
jgi:hypothetical protein